MARVRRGLEYSAKEHRARYERVAGEAVRLANRVDRNLRSASERSCPEAFAALQMMHYEMGRANADFYASGKRHVAVHSQTALRSMNKITSEADHHFFQKCVVKKGS